jgi:N-acetylneuraminate synthase
MRELFGCEVGLSDHTMGTGASVAAVALGATVIEKHFTLRRADGGVDSAFSLEPQELAALVTETRRAWEAMGAVRYGPTDAEKASLAFRRSLYAVKDIKAGETLTAGNVRAIRPGLGLAPRHLDSVLGRKARQDIAAGTALKWDLL